MLAFGPSLWYFRKPFWMIISMFYQIIRCLNNIKIFSIYYMSIAYFSYTISKWCTIFNILHPFYFISLFCCIIYSAISNSYCSFNKYVCTTIITWTWLYHYIFKFNFISSLITSSFSIVTYFYQSVCSIFRCLISCAA